MIVNVVSPTHADAKTVDIMTRLLMWIAKIPIYEYLVPQKIGLAKVIFTSDATGKQF